MTQRDRFTCGQRVIAGVVEEEGPTLILLPELPVQWEKIGRFKSPSTTRQRAQARIPIRLAAALPHVTADRSVPAVGGHFDRALNPIVGQSPACVGSAL